MRFLAFILTLTALTTLSGASQPGPTPNLPAIRPGVERIDVVPGRPVVLPIEIVDEKVLNRGVFEARLDDGLVIEGSIHWISARLTSRRGWLGARMRWSATPSPVAIKDLKRAPGGWYLVFSVPPEAVGLGIWFVGERHAVNWLPDPWRMGRDASGRVPTEMWAGSLPEEALGGVQLRESLSHLVSDPWLRWRGRLMLGQLEPGSSFNDQWIPDETLDAAPFEGVIDQLARYQDGLWQAALARLWVGDESAAVALRDRLGAVARFKHAWAPVFPSSPSGEQSLRKDLLNPFVDEPTLALRAQAWQLSLTEGVAWTVDDSGRTDASGAPVGTAGVVTLGTHPALVTLDGHSPETIEPRIETHRVISSPQDTAPGLAVQRAGVRVGSWRAHLTRVTGTRQGTPPGVRMGPLVNDWSLDPWIQGRETDGATVPADASVHATLYRAGQNLEQWRVFIECRVPRGFETSRDSVSLWFGPRGSPTTVLKLDAHGELRDSLLDQSLDTVPIATTPSGWSAVIELPPASLEPGRLLRVGMTRALGDTRTAFPRRMLPWDTEPGRLVIDLDAWDGF